MINWQLQMSMSGDKEHSLLYLGDYNGVVVQIEIHTPKRKNGAFGKEQRYFFIVDDKREFRTEEELREAINSEYRGERRSD